MTRAPRRLGFVLLATLATLGVACGEPPTSPEFVEVAPPEPSYSVGAPWDGTCDPVIGWAVYAGFPNIMLPYCISVARIFLGTGEDTDMWVVAANADDLRLMSNLEWVYHADDTQEPVGSPPVGFAGAEGGEVVCSGGRSCTYAPQRSGRIYLKFTFAGLYEVELLGPVIRVGDATPGSCTGDASAIRLVDVFGPNARSFTSLPGESDIAMQGELLPQCSQAGLMWDVRDAPDDAVVSIVPPDIESGPEVGWRVPTHSRSRWPSAHPGELSEKALSYEVRAYFTDDAGARWETEPVTVTQDPTDVIRQEYVEFGVPNAPGRSEFGVYAASYFKASELNSGDYPVFLSTSVLRHGLDAFRTAVGVSLTRLGYQFGGLVMTGGYRNPVHHLVHIRASSISSQHLYGNAGDIRIRDLGPSKENVFTEMKVHAKKLSPVGCFEPEATVKNSSTDGTLDHFHLDFRFSCPKGW